MRSLVDVLLARDQVSAPFGVYGMGSDGGLTYGGTTPATVLGLSAVWRSLDILSNGVSQLPWKEWRGNLELPPSRLVRRPQAARTRREWTSLIVSTLALYDVAYLLKVGEDAEGVPLGLWYIDPTIVAPATVNVYDVNYLLPPSLFTIGGQEVSRDQLVILHRSPQPTIGDQMGGLINLARTEFAAALAADRYASRYWQSGGSPTDVLETDAKLPPTVKDELSEAWRLRKAKGPDYAPVLDGGVKARMYGADPTAQAAVEARREQVADIGRYFGIPTAILNAPAGDTETYNTTEAQGIHLITYTLRNYMNAIEDAISDVLPGGRTMRMDSYQLTRASQFQEAQALALATGQKAWLAVDEAREVWGLPPIEEPDELNPPAPMPTVTAGPSVGANMKGMMDEGS